MDTTSQRTPEVREELSHQAFVKPVGRGGFDSLNKTRSSSSEVRVRVPFFSFSVVYFSRGTLPQKRGEKGTTGGPRKMRGCIGKSILRRCSETVEKWKEGETHRTPKASFASSLFKVSFDGDDVWDCKVVSDCSWVGGRAGGVGGL